MLSATSQSRHGEKRGRQMRTRCGLQIDMIEMQPGSRRQRVAQQHVDLAIEQLSEVVAEHEFRQQFVPLQMRDGRSAGAIASRRPRPFSAGATASVASQIARKARLIAGK